MVYAENQHHDDSSWPSQREGRFKHLMAGDFRSGGCRNQSIFFRAALGGYKHRNLRLRRTIRNHNRLFISRLWGAENAGWQRAQSAQVSHIPFALFHAKLLSAPISGYTIPLSINKVLPLMMPRNQRIEARIRS